jgi:hypothetical protein
VNALQHAAVAFICGALFVTTLAVLIIATDDLIRRYANKEF